VPRSRADLEFDGGRGQKARLMPPMNLAGLEREIFISVVASASAEHFVAEDIPLLAAYACSIAQQRRAADELAGGSQDRHWIDMHAQAVRSMNMLAMRLRLGPKARDRNNNQRRQATTLGQVSAYDSLGYDASPPTFKGFRK